MEHLPGGEPADRGSIQQRLYPQLTCFGCGHANPKGLRLNSYAVDGEVVADFRPWPEHDNGFGYLNGGIIATVLDCHSAAAVFHDAEARGRVMAGGDPLPYVTAGLDVRFLRPTPLSQTLRLRAVIDSVSTDDVIVVSELAWDGRVRAAARSSWKRWRPR